MHNFYAFSLLFVGIDLKWGGWSEAIPTEKYVILVILYFLFYNNYLS